MQEKKWPQRQRQRQRYVRQQQKSKKYLLTTKKQAKIQKVKEQNIDTKVQCIVCLNFGIHYNLTLTAQQHATHALSNLPSDLYFSKPHRSAFYNLSSKQLSSSIRFLLDLRLKFCIQINCLLGFGKFLSPGSNATH